MSSNLKVNTILPSAGTAIGIGTAGGNLNVDGGCKVQVGTALTLGHTQGLQFHTQNLHSTGFEVNNVNASGIITATKFVGPFENTGDFTIDDYIVHAGDTDTKFGFSSADTFSVETGGTERFLIQSDGSIGINATSPSAGDLASGDSQNKPLLHVNGSGASATTGEYNLLARFEAGTDADGTGAMIVLNHANDRGLAIQGGRRTGNYAHGALKMIDNVGRLSNAIFIHGGAGQGVDHMGFYTGASTTTTERIHINAAGGVGIGTVPTASSSRLTLYEESGNGQTIEIKAKNNGGVGSQPGIKFTHQNGSGVANIYTDNSSSSLRFATGASVSNRVIITPTGDFNTYNDTNDEGIFVRNTANNAAIRIYASGGSPSGAYRITHNGPTDAFQIDRTNTNGAYSDQVLGFYANRTWKRAPIGTVIKVGYDRYDPNADSYATINQDTKARSAITLDYTCQRTDSKLIIITRMHTRMINANGCSYGIDYSTNSGGSWAAVDGMAQRNAMDFFYKGDSVNHHYTGFCMRQIDAYSGTRRFSPWGQGWGGGTWEISYGHGEHSITIFEIAT